jgi:hypothetical protein
MFSKDQLTTQGLRALFKSNFDLAAYAIRLARSYIRSGHEISLEKVLEEVRRNPHQNGEEELEDEEEEIEESGENPAEK